MSEEGPFLLSVQLVNGKYSTSVWRYCTFYFFLSFLCKVDDCL